jgi:hypothetical protein
VVNSDAAAGTPGFGGGVGGAGGGNSPSGGSGRSTHPSPTRPDKAGGAATQPDPLSSPEDTPVPPEFDASGLGGLLGVGAQAEVTPAGATRGSAPAELAAPLPSRDHPSPLSSALLLALSLLIFVGLAGGAAFVWWDRRPGRYWPA